MKYLLQAECEEGIADEQPNTWVLVFYDDVTHIIERFTEFEYKEKQ